MFVSRGGGKGDESSNEPVQSYTWLTQQGNNSTRKSVPNEFTTFFKEKGRGGEENSAGAGEPMADFFPFHQQGQLG